MRALRALAFTIGVVAGSAHATTQGVVCHIDYGGATQRVVARSTADPYAVKPVAIGSYFLFRVVVPMPNAPVAAVRIFVYADRDEGPVPIHVAEYPYPLAARTTKPGFTGWHSVYEPVRDGELQYWCARSP